jgi:acyl dehydratase
MGKYFDDWTVGERFTTAGRTITETDVVIFAAMSGDYNELHTNKAYMEKDKHFGERIAHGLLGLAISHGLFSRTGYLERTPIAFLGLESWQFRAPIFLGDTVHVAIEVVEKKVSSSKPDRGVVKFALQLLDQDHTVVQEGIKAILFKRKIQQQQ